MVIDASLGNPGSHWVISYALPRTTGTFTAQNRLGAFYTALAYDPAVSGALQTLAFSMDVSSLSTSFAFDSIGQLRPALLQDGVVYTVINDDLIPSKSPLGVYQTRQWSFDAVASDWVTAVAGSSQRPDFGAGASPIFTGFRFAMGTNCSGASGCAPASAFLSVDNFSATLTPVPEPSTWLLLGAGLGCLALRRRT
ncbi:MAG: PEP-CTERM sorting domain-containing protein [Rubrivivax sp.]|nr:MAG: PEP-CTERM sorting domain-containing protein [Rubrivivax sp.]